MKRARLLLTLMVVLFIFVAIPQVALPSLQAQDGSALATPLDGQTAYEFVAQIDQSNFDLTINGYLTYVSGVAGDALFVEGTDPANRNEASAFFTIQATGTIYARSVLQSIFNTNANLTLTVYYNQAPAASFEDSASFAAGVPVAEYTVRLQTILNVQSPDVGIANSNGEVVQTMAESFDFNGQQMTFGQVGQMQRLTAFGQGFRQSQVPLVVRLLTAGNAVVIGSPE